MATTAETSSRLRKSFLAWAEVSKVYGTLCPDRETVPYTLAPLHLGAFANSATNRLPRTNREGPICHPGTLRLLHWLWRCEQMLSCQACHTHTPAQQYPVMTPFGQMP